MKKRPGLFAAAASRLTGLLAVSVLTLMTVTGTVFASGGQLGDSGAGCAVDSPLRGPECLGSLPVIVPVVPVEPAAPVVPLSDPPSQPTATPPAAPPETSGSNSAAPANPAPQATSNGGSAPDILGLPNALPGGQSPSAGCPAQSSRGGTLGRIKMTLHIQQQAFGNCPITPFYFDPPVTDTGTSAAVAACLTAYQLLAGGGLIPYNATITLLSIYGDTCIFVAGILVGVNPQPGTIPATAATIACNAAFQQALIGGFVTNAGFWVVTDLLGDTCLFNNGLLQALRSPADTSLAPQLAIGRCLTAWQQALLAGTAVLSGYYVLPDVAGDTCVFFNSVLQSIQLPGTLTLFWTGFI